MQVRENLAALIERRAASAARMDAVRASLAKLHDTATIAAPIEAEIAALDAESARAFGEWARLGGDSEPPTPDSGKRDALGKRLAKARAQASAASAAVGPLNAEMTAEARAAEEIEREIEAATAETLLVEIEAMLADFREATATVAKLRQVIGEGREAALRLTEALRGRGHIELTGPIYRRLERIDSNLHDSLASTPPVAGAGRAWLSLMADLAHDADARLKL